MSKSNEPTAIIPTDNLSLLQEKLAKLNVKAEKLGLEAITLTTGAITVLDHPYDKGGKYEAVEVFVEGTAPKLNGWIFAATLEHDENGTLVRRIPTFETDVDLSQYRTASPDHCDQCNTRRRRNDTYVVVHENGETKQVGSSCLKDFTGHENPQAIARFLELVRELIENAGSEYSGGKITPRYDLDDFLTTAAAVIRNHGYITRRRAVETGETPTGEVARNDYFNRLNRITFHGEPSWTVVTDTDSALAAKAVEWVRALTEKDLENEYLYNLYTVCKSGTLTSRQFGIAASAITAYQRAESQRIEREATNRVDEFLAEPKERVEPTFTVERVFANDGDYGVSYKHILRTTTGHRLVWRTTSEQLEVGKQYTGNFSVKENREDNYGKASWIWRPRKGTLKEV